VPSCAEGIAVASVVLSGVELDAAEDGAGSPYGEGMPAVDEFEAGATVRSAAKVVGTVEVGVVDALVATAATALSARADVWVP
jgi:hypothetical protein